MSETSKKTLLDTDFLFKTQLAQNRNREPLADLIMQFDGYDFFCHEKIISELLTHGFSPDPIPWIEEQQTSPLPKEFLQRAEEGLQKNLQPCHINAKA